jgi:predicted kinase
MSVKSSLPEAGAAVPDPALVVLVGPSGSGKSAWAAARYRPREVVSSDQLRAVVGSGEHDLDASDDAFTLLDQIVAARVRRGLTTVIDTLGLDPGRRRGYLELARRHGLAGVAVLFDTGPAECRRRNRARDRAVPAAVLDGQLRRMRATVVDIESEGWDLVLPADPADPARSARPEPSHTPGARRAARQQRQRRSAWASCYRSPGSAGTATPPGPPDGSLRWPATRPRPACKASR